MEVKSPMIHGQITQSCAWIKASRAFGPGPRVQRATLALQVLWWVMVRGPIFDQITIINCNPSIYFPRRTLMLSIVLFHCPIGLGAGLRWHGFGLCQETPCDIHCKRRGTKLNWWNNAYWDNCPGNIWNLCWLILCWPIDFFITNEISVENIWAAAVARGSIPCSDCQMNSWHTTWSSSHDSVASSVCCPFFCGSGSQILL